MNTVKKYTFEVILGSYEEFLIGYKFNSKDEDLTQSFASHSHSSSVRCVTHCGPYLTSGGADDRIVVYDLRSRKVHSMLTHHNGTVNCLQFTSDHTHLITGSSDGVLAVTRIGNWQLEKVWENAHKGKPIIDLAIHPSNKLALTLGADNTLRTWNLVKGRQAYVINLNSKSKDPKSLHFIKWAPDSVHFILGGGLYLEIWNIESGGLINSIEFENKVTSGLWLSDERIIISHENGELHEINIEGEILKTIKTHDSRVKALDFCDNFLVTCASNGEVKVWNDQFKEIAKCTTGCRHTCMCVVKPISFEDNNLKKREHENVDLNAESDIKKKKSKKKNAN